MKSVVVIPIEPGSKEKEKERRKLQRRMAVPRRVNTDRRDSEFPSPEELGRAGNRRMPRERRRLPDRRLGLKINLPRL
jgi:hypothetical protein